jgi:hypothetical protein
MIKIRRFNEHIDDNEYYKSINYDTFNKEIVECDENRYEDFTEEEISILNKLLKFHHLDRYQVAYLNNTRKQEGIYITKKTDDWFYVSIPANIDDLNYFKCDQFDGLLKFVDDLNNNKII